MEDLADQMELASPLSPIKSKQFKIALESTTSGGSKTKQPHSRGFHHQSSAMSQDYSDQKAALDCIHPAQSAVSRFADSAFGVPS